MIALDATGGTNRYAGEIASKSQVVRSDGSGHLIFFILDGRIFDAEGYLIADAAGSGCIECVEPGVMEMHAVPVPGQCDLYFILSMNPANASTPHGSRIHVSVLNMSADNGYWPGRKGRLLGIWNGELENLYPDLSAFVGALDLPTVDYSDSHAWMPSLFGSFNPKSNAPLLRVIDPVGDGARFWMYAIYKDRVLPYRIDATGIWSVGTGIAGAVPTYQMSSPFNMQNIPFSHKSYLRDADVTMGLDSKVVLALSDCNLYAYNAQSGTTSGGNQLLVMRFDGQTGAFINSTGHVFTGGGGLPDFDCGAQLPNNGGPIPPPEPGMPTGMNGLALVHNGSKVIITGERVNSSSTGWDPTIGLYDVASQQWTDLVAQLTIANPVKFVRTRLMRNKLPWSSERSVFIPYGLPPLPEGNIAAIANTEGGTMAFWSQLFTFVPVQIAKYIEPANVSSGNYTPYFFNAQVIQDNYAVSQLSGGSAPCCGFRELLGSSGGYMHSNANGTSFTAANNPWGNVADVKFNGDVVIPAGTQLSVHGMTWRFGPNAKLIIERGGRLTSYSSVFTTVVCDNAHWPGIRVEGTTTNPNQFGTAQGQLRMYDSRVEYADVGIWCARVNGNFMDPAFFGGLVRASNTTFRDCQTGVRIERYRRINPNNSESLHLGYFGNCKFETTAGWRGPTTPGWFAKLGDVKGVTFTGCSFVNQIPNAFYPYTLRGGGISATSAAFTCSGYQNYTTNRFENLHVGVSASVPDPALLYKIDGMGFKNNFQGVVDYGSTDTRITNNQFVTMQNITPLTVTSIGLHLFQSERYVVERNTFTDQGPSVPSVGIWFNGPAFQANRIYDNTFTALNVGCFVEGRHKASTGTPQTAPGLQMLCGDHTDNLCDQFILGDQGYIQYQQGLPSSGNTTANNQYFTSPSCTNGVGTTNFNPFVFAFNNYGLQVKYNYYGNANSPQMRPGCIEDQGGNPISFIGEWFYDLFDVQVSSAFNKSVNCGSGVLDQSGGGTVLVSGLMLEHQQKQAELRSAWNQYNGTVDQMKTEDILGMLEYKPWHPSYPLRDSLLAAHPLSDEVLVAAIKREEPLDVWHLTQVLIQNSPLSPWVWSTIKELEPLPLYYYNLVKQYDQGVGLKGLLEEEITLRQQEKTLVQTLLFDALASDSTLAGLRDSLELALTADSLGDGTRGLYLGRLHAHDFAGAALLETQLESSEDLKDLPVWGRKYALVEGDWEQLSASERGELFNLAHGHQAACGALAWATLLDLNETDSVPNLVLPAGFKSLWSPKDYEGKLGTEEQVELYVLPNPATDRIAFTYPLALARGVLEVHDSQGKQVFSTSLVGRTGLLEWNVRELPSGLYTVRLVAEAGAMHYAKFTVTH